MHVVFNLLGLCNSRCSCLLFGVPALVQCSVWHPSCQMCRACTVLPVLKAGGVGQLWSRTLLVSGPGVIVAVLCRLNGRRVYRSSQGQSPLW